MTDEYFKAPVIIGQTPGERIIALEAQVRRLRTALEKARRIADDLTQQAYESTTQGGVFFDTLSALRAALEAGKENADA
jgi:hypothetical protein